MSGVAPWNGSNIERNTVLTEPANVQDGENAGHAIQRLLTTMAKLRDPETGCPWDVEQTFATIAPYTIEEAYEVADAIANNDMSALKDELGDLLLQAVFHAQMADEAGLFSFDDVANTISEKLVRRHPHVFADGDRSAFTLDVWEASKADERAAKGRGEKTVGVLDDVALALPALTRAEKLQKRAARVGFDWENIDQIFDKTDEEIAELKVAIGDNSQAEGERFGPDSAVAEELGDLLFSVVNLARRLGVDPELALRNGNDKFMRRFGYIEKKLKAMDREFSATNLAELEALWQDAKRSETRST